MLTIPFPLCLSDIVQYSEHLTPLLNIYIYPTIGPNERERSLSLMESWRR